MSQSKLRNKPLICLPGPPAAAQLRGTGDVVDNAGDISGLGVRRHQRRGDAGAADLQGKFNLIQMIELSEEHSRQPSSRQLSDLQQKQEGNGPIDQQCHGP